MAEQTIQLLASAYSVSSSAITVTNPTNAYADLDSTSYASVNNSSSTNRAYFFGFDFSQIPSSATVTNVTYKIKVQNPSTGSVQLSLYNLSSSTSISNSVTATTYTTNIYSLTPTSMTFDDIAALGNNFAFSVQISTSNRSCYVYGMEVLVSYDYPATNKVIYNGRTLIDLTNDDTLPEDVTAGKIFHLANGEQATGTAAGIEEETGTWKPTSDIAGASAPKIMFSNTHTSPPTLVLMATSTAFSPTRYAIFGTCLVNWEKLNVSFPVPSGLTTARYAGFITNYYSSTSVLTMVASSPITHSSDDTGSADNSYYRFHADKTGYKPYSSQANVFFKANVTYNWRALWI